MDPYQEQHLTWPERFFESDQYMSVLLDYIPDAIVISNEQGEIIYINKVAVGLFGYQPNELIGKRIEILIPQHLRQHHVTLREQYKENPVMREMGRNLTLYATNKSGRDIPVDISLSPLKTTSGFVFLSMVRDITSHKYTQDYLEELNRTLAHLARHDPLTKLANRSHFIDSLQREISRSERHNLSLAVLFIDLDHFKEINDQQGHHIGDAVLIEVARRLEGCLRKEDFIARLGGDELAVILPEIKSSEHATLIANKIIDQCNKSFLIEDLSLKISASIGIAIAPKDATDPEALLKYADLAMYQAKNNGRNQYKVYVG